MAIELPRSFAELHAMAFHGDREGGLPGRPGIAVASVPRRSRRLADKLLLAFHHACDQNELSLAWRLLALVEVAHERAGGSDLGERRRNIGPLVAAHERLWELRHASAPAGKAGKQQPPLP